MKLLHSIVIDEKEIIDVKTIAKKFNEFFVNIGPKPASEILVLNTHYVKYEGPDFERKDLCNKSLKNTFSSLKSNKNSGIKSVK